MKSTSDMMFDIFAFYLFAGIFLAAGGLAPKIAFASKLQSLHQNYKELLSSRVSAHKVCYDTTVTGAASPCQ
jgi:hypothetical protein